MPYWDWIRPRARRVTKFPGESDNNKTVAFPYSYDLPEVLARDTLKVYKPGDETTLVDIDNPFLTYHFPENGSLETKDWKVLDDCDDMVRLTTTSKSIAGTDERTGRTPNAPRV